MTDKIEVTLSYCQARVLEEIERIGRDKAQAIERWNMRAQTAPSVPDGWQPIETAPRDGTHVLLANKTGTRVADGMYGNYKVWSWPYVMVEPAYWRPMPAAPGAQTTPNVQEPVAEVAWAADIPNSIIELRPLQGYVGKIGDKLYLAPGAQPAHEPSAAAIEHALKAASGFTATWSDAQPAPRVLDENAAFEAWFRSEQGTPYDGMWSFARAAWMARAKLVTGAQENNDV